MLCVSRDVWQEQVRIMSPNKMGPKFGRTGRINTREIQK